MTPEVSEKAAPVGETSCSEPLHQAHLKPFWFIGPDSTQSSSEANFREIERKMLSPRDLSLPGAESVPSTFSNPYLCSWSLIRMIFNKLSEIFHRLRTINLMPLKDNLFNIPVCDICRRG
jgi:hypothetical protein